MSGLQVSIEFAKKQAAGDIQQTLTLKKSKSDQFTRLETESEFLNVPQKPAELKIQKYDIINELTSGQLFGDISSLTKYLMATATVKTVDVTFWGVLNVEDLEGYHDVLVNRIYEYKDDQFAYWHNLIKNITWLNNISDKWARSICLVFKKIKHNGRIIDYQEYNDHTYFILKGKLFCSKL